MKEATLCLCCSVQPALKEATLCLCCSVQPASMEATLCLSLNCRFLRHAACLLTVCGARSRVAQELPHQGLAKRCAVQRAACNLTNVRAQPTALFDGASESKVGFESVCCLLLPVVHRGELLGVVQLTNKTESALKEGASDDDADAPPRDAAAIQTLLFGPPPPSAAKSDDGDGGGEEDDEEEDVSAGVDTPPPPPSMPRFSPEDEAAAKRLLATAALLLLPKRNEAGRKPAAPKQEAASPEKAASFTKGVAGAPPHGKRPPKKPERAPQLPALVTLPNVGGGTLPWIEPRLPSHTIQPPPLSRTSASAAADASCG